MRYVDVDNGAVGRGHAWFVHHECADGSHSSSVPCEREDYRESEESRSRKI